MKILRHFLWARKKTAAVAAPAVMLTTAVVAVPPAVATHDGTAGGHDFAVGGTQHIGGALPGIPTLASINEGFAAHSDPTGEDPHGHVSATLVFPSVVRPLELKGRVICVDVDGNTARIRYVAEKSDVPGFPEGGEVVLTVVDNGNPQNGQPVDTIGNTPGSAAPRTLAFPCGAGVTVPATKGNIVVHDAAP